MRIQNIYYSKNLFAKKDFNTIFSEVYSFDLFDLNVLHLEDKNIWYNKSNNYDSIDCMKDLTNITKSILTSQNSKVLIILPQNINYNYKYDYDSGYRAKSYQQSVHLKDINSNLSEIVCRVLGYNGISLYFEKNITKVNEIELTSDFYFETIGESKVLTESMVKKNTTILLDNRVAVTTLNITEENIDMYINSVFNFESVEPQPEWLESINILNDEKLKERKEILKKDIASTNKKLENVNLELNNNKKYKSILYVNGNILDEIIKNMLGEMLEYSLDNFVDVKKEDFLIELENDISFIGEIKGINTNVKTKNIHQIEGRKLDYIEQKPDKSVYSLLIINYQRDRDINKREPIADEQIRYAKRDNCLIISTITFLKLYESYKSKTLTKEQIINILKNENNVGELKTNDFSG